MTIPNTINYYYLRSIFSGEKGEKAQPLNNSDHYVHKPGHAVVKRETVDENLRAPVPNRALASRKASLEAPKTSPRIIEDAAQIIKDNGLDEYLHAKYLEIGVTDYGRDLCAFLAKRPVTFGEKEGKIYLAEIFDLTISENGMIQGDETSITSKIQRKLQGWIYTSASREDVVGIVSGDESKITRAAENLLAQFEQYEALWRELETVVDDDLNRKFTKEEVVLAKTMFFNEGEDWYAKFLRMVTISEHRNTPVSVCVSQ